MTRVTGKFQITLPKRLAEAYGIHVGDEVELVAAGRHIALLPPGMTARPDGLAVEERLRQFDEATERQRVREEQADLQASSDEAGHRGWTREDLYERGRPG